MKKYSVLIGIIFVLVISLYINISRATKALSFHHSDLNANLIWDDIEPNIAGLGDSPVQKNAIRQFVLAYQEALLNPETASNFRNQKTKINRVIQAEACIYKIWGSIEDAPRVQLKDAILNAEGRIQAWLRYNSNLSGSVISLWNEETDGDPCVN